MLINGPHSKLKVGAPVMVQGVWEDNEKRVEFFMICTRRKCLPKVCSFVECEVKEEGGERIVTPLWVNDHRMKFVSCFGVIRRFFVVNHPGGLLERLDFRVLTISNQCLARSVWPTCSTPDQEFSSTPQLIWSLRVPVAPPLVSESSALVPKPGSLLAKIKLGLHGALRVEKKEPAVSENMFEFGFSDASRSSSEGDVIDNPLACDRPVKCAEKKRVKRRMMPKKNAKPKCKVVKLSKLVGSKKKLDGPPAGSADIDVMKEIKEASDPPSSAAVGSGDTIAPLVDGMVAHDGEPVGKKGRGSGVPWIRFDYGEHGFFVHNETNNSIAAHCRRHGGRCRVPKVLSKKPMGHLLLWLIRGEDPALKFDSHMALRHDLKDIDSYEDRKLAREEGMAVDSLQEAFLFEAMVCMECAGAVEEPFRIIG